MGHAYDVGQASLVGRTVYCSLPLAACMVPYSTVKTIPQGEGSCVHFISNSRSSMSKLCGVFSKRNLPSTSGRQPKAFSRLYYFEIVLASPDHNLKGDFSCPVLGFY